MLHTPSAIVQIREAYKLYISELDPEKNERQMSAVGIELKLEKACH
jgi:hypothetical protein